MKVLRMCKRTKQSERNEQNGDNETVNNVAANVEILDEETQLIISLMMI